VKRSAVPTELGVHNPRVDRLRALLTPRGRREQARFTIEGPTLIGEARRGGVVLREVYAVAEALAAHPDVAGLEAADLPIFTVTARLYARFSDLETPSGLLAVADLPTADPQAILAAPGTVLLLAGLNDPGNAGTLLRSAEAFGAAGALFGRGSVDAYSPKVVRAAMGALFRLPTATVDARWLLDAAAAAGRPIIAADGDGDDVTGLALPPRAVLAVGNERRGVRDWLPSWDRAISIPHQGPTESLNAAVAGSILLYLMSQQR
jgi:TrmH family RNA methyltransferase